MLSYLPELDPEGNVKPVFNASDFSYIYGYATLAELLQYANLYISNTFTASQNFTAGIQTTSINNITQQTISYLANVTSDIQQQFQNILTLLTNYVYDTSSQTQMIKKNTAFTDIIICNQSNMNSLLNNQMLTNSIQANTITTQNLYIQNNPYPICFLYYGQAIYPLLKSGLLANLTGLSISSNVSMYVTIAPNYQIQFMTQEGILLSSITNNTLDYLHYQGVAFGSYTPYNFSISRIV